MTITARILADSYCRANSTRLTTFELRYPRFMHSELMTHRYLSRNAASSRAIPIAKAVQAVIDDPAMPLVWGRNQAGMQAGEELTGDARANAERAWLSARDSAVQYVRSLDEIGLHKQHATRIIEPWSHITVIVSATEMANFYKLRRDPQAMPEFRALANEMYERQHDSRPDPLDYRIGIWQWHLPLVSNPERAELDTLYRQSVEAADGAGGTHPAIKVCVGRCARVSYLTHSGERSFEADIELHDKLKMSGHWSPFEHAACPGAATHYGNFYGWQQYRKLLREEHPYTPGQTFP